MKHPTPNTQLFNATKKNDCDAIRSLIKAGVDINCRNKAGATPFLIAVLKKNHNAAAVLIGLGSDLNATDHQGRGCNEYAAGLIKREMEVDLRGIVASMLITLHQGDIVEKEHLVRL